ncbi:MAG: hypothetical protein M3449_00765, partial [Acidobacteriota bacterium]|nr:hypothetical protein [Acidobacteriota bacterium]
MKIFITLILLVFTATFSQAQQQPPTESSMDRFLRYVKIDTQSAEVAGKVPSTEKQLVLARLLEKELKELNAQNVRVSEFGIVYAMI